MDDLNDLEIVGFEDEYEEIADVRNKALPDHKTSAEELRFHDENRSEKCKFKRFLGTLEDNIVGVSSYSQSSSFYHPRKFWINVTVKPEHQKRGIGSILYDHVNDELREHNPISLRGGVREDMKRGIRFAQDRGFEEDRREWESHLDVDDFDPESFQRYIERVREEGIKIKSLKELEGDESRDKKLFELFDETLADIPSSEEYTGVDFDQFIRFFESPNLLLEGYLVAVHGSEYVGMTNLWKPEKGDYLDTGFTSVKKGYRGKGLATALKVKVIEFAKEKGYSKIKTWNDSTNEGMLYINQKLGFERKPSWIQFVKELG